MSELKPCKVCNYTRRNSHGLVVPSLDQLKTKGCESLGFGPGASVSVVLEDDGTIVEDEAYFLCLPSNTKFMLLQEKERWAPVTKIDGGTAWLSRESIDLETDVVDSAITAKEPWRALAIQLKQDMASVVLMSEADLQSLVDVPCSDLAAALDFGEKKVESFQETLQRVLDQREESRQSKELLQLYLKTMEKEKNQEEGTNQEVFLEADTMVETDGTEVDSESGFTSRTLMVLKGKSSPETRLSNVELQAVSKKGAEAMERLLGWDAERTSLLLQACEDELGRRLEKVQAMQSLSSQSPQAMQSLSSQSPQAMQSLSSQSPQAKATEAQNNNLIEAKRRK